MQAPPDIDYKAMYEEETALYKETKAKLELAVETIALLQHQNDQFQKMLFGSTNERFVPSNPARDNNAQPEAMEVPADQEGPALKNRQSRNLPSSESKNPGA